MNPYEYEEELDKYIDKYLAAKNRADKLIDGPGGIMEMKQTIADKEAEIERLNKKVKQLGNDLKEMAYYYYLMVGEGDDNTEEARGLMFEYKFVDDDGFWIEE